MTGPAAIRVVFLDIDGVLNSVPHFAAISGKISSAESIMIDPAAVERLNRLVEEADAVVVISSSWRCRANPDEVRQMLESRGFRGKVIGYTPELNSKCVNGTWIEKTRGDEINQWLSLSPLFGINVSSFVILDDDSDMAHLAHRHIKTSFDDGIQDHHVDMAIGMLGGNQ